MAAAGAALIVALSFKPVFEDVPFFPFWMAVILTSLYGGLGPGLVASALSALAINYFFQEPLYSLALSSESMLQIALFLFANGSIGYLYERRRQAEAQIDEQREWLQTTLSSIGDAVVATDLNGCIVFFNNVASQLTGWPAREALGQAVQTVFHIVNEETRLPVENPVLRAIRDGQSVDLANHTVLISRDGSERFIADSGSPIHDPRGQPVGAVLIFRDISARRVARRELELSESRFRAAQELSLDAFTVLEAVRDATGKICDFRWTYANPEAGRILGHAPEELIGRRLLDQLPGNKEDSQLFDRYVHVVETGEPHDLELNYHSEGIDGWFRNMCVRLGDGVAVSFRDITERKRIEIAEREQRQLAETMRDIAIALGRTLNLADALNIILNGVQRIVPCETVDVMLCDSEEMIFVAGSRGYTGRGLDELMNGLHFPYRDLPLLRRAAETRQPVVVPDVKNCPDWVPMDFEEWRCSYVCVPIQLQQEIIGFLNVTSVEADYFQVTLVERLGRFAHQIALAVQNARLYEKALEAAATRERERLARDLHDAVSQTLFAASIIAESVPRQWQSQPEKVLPLLDQLRQLTHGAQAEMRTLLLELRPAALLEANLKTLLPQLADAIQSRKRIAIELNIDEPDSLPPDVKMSLYRITQEALNNIAKHSNATQASVLLRHENGQVELMVSDNGCGFDPASIAPTSLGLGIMHERAAAINASLTISAQPGSGTSVHTRWAG